MTNRDRRGNMALDDAYIYCRRLEYRQEKPELYTVCSALHTVDAAIATASIEEGKPVGPRISVDAWLRIRNNLFNFLITSFPGYFLLYKDADASPLEAGSEWPEQGMLEFFPERSRRREDSYICDLEDMEPRTLTSLRWCFAEGRQNIRPSDFEREPVLDEEEVNELMGRFYEVCEEEAERGKKRAHQKWWQLYWEATSCRDAHQKRQIHKDMDRLQSVWGKPS